MANVPRDIKKSEFISKVAADITSGATFDFVLNGTNYKVPFSELLKAVGSIGTLEQTGDSTGVPVLQTVDIVNKIRNIIGGAGVLVSLSPENGIQIEHNFDINNTGVPVIIDSAAESPTVRSLLGVDGIGVSGSNGTIRIAYTGDLPPTSNNVVIVNDMDDFPDPESGVITLGDDTAYLVSANLSTTSRFVLGNNCTVYAADTTVSSLTYTGSDTMFTSVNKNNKLTRIALSAPSGKLFDVSGSSGIFQLVDVTIDQCAEIGTITDLLAVQITDVFFSSITVGGVSFGGSIGTFIGTRNVAFIAGGTFLDLGTAVFIAGFSLETTTVTVGAGATFLSGLVDSGNIDAASLGSVLNCRLLGTGTILNNINERDDRWAFFVNDGIPNTTTSLLASKDASTITIAAINTPVIIGPTWTFDHESRFEGAAGGRFTYTGKGSHINITGAVSAIGVVSQSRDFEFQLYKNGVPISSAVFSRSFNNVSSGSVGITWQEDLVNGDYLELWVQNTESADDLDIISATLGFSS